MILTWKDAFRSDLKASGVQVPNFRTYIFFKSRERQRDESRNAKPTSAIPSRMASDQMLNTFLQEWLPLFPILHRSRLLKLYSDFVASPESIESHHDNATLYLMFAISAVSAEVSIFICLRTASLTDAVEQPRLETV